MSRPLRALLLAAALLAPAPAARAVSIVTLPIAPAGSTLVPQVGAPQTLGGSITFRIGTLPLGGSNTPFDVIALSATASGGATIGLDPAIANPGLGVLTPGGSFLIPTLFLRLDDGSPLDVAIPDVTGTVTFGPGGATIAAFSAGFEVDAGAPAGIVAVQVSSVPEPAVLALVALGLAAFGARRLRTEASR